MTKTEVISAINETIRTNGNKGITADSLALILNEIVNLSPEEQEEPSYEVLSASLLGFENEDWYNTLVEGSLPEGVTVGQVSEIFESIVAENKTIFDKAKNLILTGKTPILANSYKLMIELMSLSGEGEPIYMRTIFTEIDYHGEYSLNVLESITNESAEIPDFILLVMPSLSEGTYLGMIFTEDGQAWEVDMFVDYYNNL